MLLDGVGLGHLEIVGKQPHGEPILHQRRRPARTARRHPPAALPGPARRRPVSSLGSSLVCPQPHRVRPRWTGCQTRRPKPRMEPMSESREPEHYAPTLCRRALAGRAGRRCPGVGTQPPGAHRGRARVRDRAGGDPGTGGRGVDVAAPVLPDYDVHNDPCLTMVADEPAVERTYVIRVAAVGDIHFGTDSAGTLRPHLDDLAEQADVLLLAGDLTRLGTPRRPRCWPTSWRGVACPWSPCSATTTTTRRGARGDRGARRRRRAGARGRRRRSSSRREPASASPARRASAAGSRGLRARVRRAG